MTTPKNVFILSSFLISAWDKCDYGLLIISWKFKGHYQTYLAQVFQALIMVWVWVDLRSDQGWTQWCRDIAVQEIKL